MKNILVTGGAGYVGSILLRKLLNNCYRVVCLDCLRFGDESIIDLLDHPNFVFHNCDIINFDGVDKIINDDYCYSEHYFCHHCGRELKGE